jgi:predicted dehydrogenase
MRHPLSSATRLSRRRLVAGVAALPVACRAALPPGGVFAAGGDRIRVGVVGCGGRGTGAALDAVAADAGVVITSLADAFADQLDSSAALLSARAGTAFQCPPWRRFVGLAGWRMVVDSDVDLVILATPPVFRPLHAAAAVRAGRHVWCETPGAVDGAGVRLLSQAVAEAAARGLSFASGLAPRHGGPAAELLTSIRAGAAGRPLAVTVRGDLGLPWLRQAGPGDTTADLALRNWIWHPHLSGGHLVEHHVAALDKALWVLDDVDPVVAIPGPRPSSVRHELADGRHIDAALRRRPGATGVVVEQVRCTHGVRDLRTPASASSPDPLRLGMSALVAAIRATRRLDDGPRLCRATQAAIAGRTALATGAAVPWSGAVSPGLPSPPRPLQSVQS